MSPITVSSPRDRWPASSWNDVDAARSGLEAAGAELLGPVGRGGPGEAWQHFRAPDGNVYELTARPR